MAKYLDYEGLEYYTEYVKDQLSGKAAASHTHSYAGSSSAGGAATSANKLNANAGDANTPVYFSNGVPVACTSLDLSTSGSSASCTGNAATATTLATARTIQTNLGSTSGASFNGSANVAPGVTGTLPVANGGTGATTAAAARSALGVTLANLGVTATAAELNALDGIKATVTELNYCDGVTSNIQTQLDGKQAAGSYASSSHTHSNYASTVNTTGSGNAVTAISQSGNTITATKGSTFALDGHEHAYIKSNNSIWGFASPVEGASYPRVYSAITGKTAHYGSSTTHVLGTGEEKLLAGKLLYSNASGTTGTIALSESAANFAMLEVQFTDGSRHQTARIHSPNGKAMAIGRIVANATCTYSSQAILTISGTSIAQSNQFQTSWEAGITSLIDTGTLLSVTQVIGWR